MLEWKTDANFAAVRYGKALGALIAANEALNGGKPFDMMWSGWQDSINVVIEAGDPVAFMRAYTPDAIEEPWMEIINDRPQPDKEGLIYDWRLALPAYLQLVALRLQVIAAIDPAFRIRVAPQTTNTSIYSGELYLIKQKLLYHYDTIKGNIRCGSKDMYLSEKPGWIITSACADINTGISLIHKAAHAALREQLDPAFPCRRNVDKGGHSAQQQFAIGEFGARRTGFVVRRRECL